MRIAHSPPVADHRFPRASAGEVMTVRDPLLKTGSIDIVAAPCCFTPLLAWLFAGMGLASAVGYLDLVLLPAPAGFLAITGYASWRRRH